VLIHVKGGRGAHSTKSEVAEVLKRWPRCSRGGRGAQEVAEVLKRWPRWSNMLNEHLGHLSVLSTVT